MKQFDEFMQEMVNLDYQNLVSAAKNAMSNLEYLCRSVNVSNGGVYMKAAIALTPIYADGEVTPLEKKMLGDVFMFDPITLQTILEIYSPEMPNHVLDFANRLENDKKQDLITLVTAFAAVDEKISKEETAFIQKLFY